MATVATYGKQNKGCSWGCFSECLLNGAGRINDLEFLCQLPRLLDAADGKGRLALHYFD